ncbi:MAG: aryl-sulfate sulfotransferase [Bacillota bacterium]|nr:aryl-sulfate sulfotransferase [Bacillota bacterium]HHU30650.1 thioredoxin [Bacillota bacterium]
MGHPTVYPMGTTIYNPEKCWNGYTLLSEMTAGAILVDMNGRTVRLWDKLRGFPNKMLPGGYIFGHRFDRSMEFGFQDGAELLQIDWEGNIVWEFSKNEYIEDPGQPPGWMARNHHDFQREGNPVGYYAPGQVPLVDRGNTLILCHRNVKNPKISDKLLLDDCILEVDWDGRVVWEWNCHEHFEELGFTEQMKKVLYRNPNMLPTGGGMGDWMHINSLSLLGPNPWYDAGDMRFKPDNIICSARETNIVFIIDKETGKIVWRLGPDYSGAEYVHIGWIIGQHHAHLIPDGLPGAGNLLLFDNGGWAGYGSPHETSKTGEKSAQRDHSRVLEINPFTLDIIWQYSLNDFGNPFPAAAHHFYSPLMSSAQRLPNGNTLICEGNDGRIFEVTCEHEIVWEYMNPHFGPNGPITYRAYRLPYEWIPQLPKPEEVPVQPPDNKVFRVPGAAPGKIESIILVEGTKDFPVFPKATPVAAAQTAIWAKMPKLFRVDTAGTLLLDEDAAGRVGHPREGLVFFGSERCRHCKEVYKLLLADSGRTGHGKNLKIYYVDVPTTPSLVRQYEVSVMPTVILLKEGKVSRKITGADQEKLTGLMAGLLP